MQGKDHAYCTIVPDTESIEFYIGMHTYKVTVFYFQASCPSLLFYSSYYAFIHCHYEVTIKNATFIYNTYKIIKSSPK